MSGKNLYVHDSVDGRCEAEIEEEENEEGSDYVQPESETGSCLEWCTGEEEVPVTNIEAAMPSDSHANSQETPEVHAEDVGATAEWERLDWYQSLAGQASMLSLEHEKMAELLALQQRCEQDESKLRAELITWQKDRQMTQKWRDKLLHDKMSEIEAATLEMKDLISKLDTANPSWKNKVCFAEMF